MICGNCKAGAMEFKGYALCTKCGCSTPPTGPAPTERGAASVEELENAVKEWLKDYGVDLSEKMMADLRGYFHRAAKA